MASLVESVNYGAINITYTATNGFYVIMFTSGAYTIQENTKIDVHIITAGDFFVKAKYLCSMQVDTNWYLNKQPKKNVITVPTSTILNPQLEVNTLTYFHAIPKSVCNRTQPKNP